MVQVGGLATGLDVNSIVGSLVSAEIGPATFSLDRKEADYQADISALGTLKSALNEFKTSLEGLDSLSDLRPRSVTSSNDALFSVSADDTAVEGSYDVRVVKLAAEQQLMSGTFASPGADVGSGTLTITRGSDTFSVTVDAASATLEDVRDAINNAEDNPGVKATIINVDDGTGNGTDSRLVISAGTTGLDNTLTISATDDDGNDDDAAGLSLLKYPPTATGNVMIQQTAADDAEIEVFGQAVYSSSNSFTDAITGVTINLLAATSDSGDTASVSVALDSGAVTTKVNDFVTAYNSMMEALDALGSYDATTEQGGVLLGDATLRTVMSNVRRELSTAVEESGLAFTTLAEIGITTQRDGRLAVDSETLSDALASNFDDVGQLFASSTGYAARLSTVVEEFVASDGPIESRIDGINSQLSDISDERAALDLRAEVLEKRYRGQFTALDQLVAELNTISSFLSQNLSSLPGFTRGNSR